MDAASRPPRVPPGGWMTISWCAVIAYTWLTIALVPHPRGPLWHQVVQSVQEICSNLRWAGLPALAAAR